MIFSLNCYGLFGNCLSTLGKICLNGLQALQTFCLYVEHLIDDLCELVGVPSKYAVKTLGFRTGLFGFLGLCQLFQRTLDQGQWGAQFMAYLCVEVELLTFHLVAFLDEAGSLQEIVIDSHDGE